MQSVRLGVKDPKVLEPEVKNMEGVTELNTLTNLVEIRGGMESGK